MITSSHFRILPLLVIVAFLSFSVRFVDVAMGVGSLGGAAIAQDKTLAQELEEALAETEAEATETDEAMEAEQKEEEGTETASEGLDENKWRDASDMDIDISDVREEVFEDITRRRNEMESREKQMMTREALLEAAERELEIKYQELTALRNQIEELLGKQEEEEQLQIQSLVKVYENMKAADAARIFNTLDLDVLLAVVSDMSERKLSPILANMNPERARTITIMLAEKKQLPTLPNAN